MISINNTKWHHLLENPFSIIDTAVICTKEKKLLKLKFIKPSFFHHLRSEILMNSAHACNIAEF